MGQLTHGVLPHGRHVGGGVSHAERLAHAGVRTRRHLQRDGAVRESWSVADGAVVLILRMRVTRGSLLIIYCKLVFIKVETFTLRPFTVVDNMCVT